RRSENAIPAQRRIEQAKRRQPRAGLVFRQGRLRAVLPGGPRVSDRRFDLARRVCERQEIAGRDAVLMLGRRLERQAGKLEGVAALLLLMRAVELLRGAAIQQVVLLVLRARVAVRAEQREPAERLDSRVNLEASDPRLADVEDRLAQLWDRARIV